MKISERIREREAKAAKVREKNREHELYCEVMNSFGPYVPPKWWQTPFSSLQDFLLDHPLGFSIFALAVSIAALIFQLSQ